jgi:tetratricopeptide (TPR) repeat protein
MSATVDESLELLKRAQELRRQGNLLESAAAYHKLIGLGVHKAEGFYGLGLVLLDSRDYGSAAAQFENCLKLDPRNANAYFYLGETWAARDASEVAQSFYRKALEINPKHAGALKRLEAPVPRAANDATRAPFTLASSGADGSSPEHLRQPGFYELIRLDPSPLALQTVRLIDSLDMSVRPAISAHLGPLLAIILLCSIPVVGISLLANSAFSSPPKVGVAERELLPVSHQDASKTPPLGATKRPVAKQFPALVLAQQILLLAAVVVPAVYILRVKTTTFTFGQGRLQISRGVFGKRLQNLELYRVVDIELRQSFLNRLLGDGTLVLLVERVGAGREPTGIALTGIARGADLEKLFQTLRSLVLLLRTGAWGKGVIY